MGRLTHRMGHFDRLKTLSGKALRQAKK